MWGLDEFLYQANNFDLRFEIQEKNQKYSG
jgi:hypothetical protein